MTSFRDLHRPGRPFLLPNAWDYASGAILAGQGFPAIGTTSLGVAAAHGLPDGAESTRESTVDVVRLLNRLPVFVTVDLEAGFSDDPHQVADLVASLNVAGVNLEDQAGPPDLLARKIAACKALTPDVFINARTDTHWLGTAQDETRRRLESYVDAGADGIFVPGLTDPSEIAALATLAPLNVLHNPSGPTLVELAALGVARVSTGSHLYRTALSAMATEAAAIAGLPTPPPYTYAAINNLSR